ncbi:2OG-Fe(II) oxygenase family protein [Parasphingorhabdus sp.]|uniref:2OG-Fe(II) oxygenase n=1 Tax=Parasphingorhabdus sp. TaxID=2709688 RepID=UPI0030A7892B|nr:2OG-Fe(II) oxygenase [Sphingomonadales bacterium]
MFTLNSLLDREKLRRQFQDEDRLSVEGFLSGNGVDALFANLRSRGDWMEIFNSGDKLIELNPTAQQKLTDVQRNELSRAIYAQAREGFQYRYETIRVPDEAEVRAAMDDVIVRFAEWISGGEAHAFFREITGFNDIDFADAQATAYSPGHFLTGHDDDFPGKNRRAAYVFNLTPVWRTEWGGLLLFHDDANAISGLVPGFNRLNIFKVPQMHSVTEVTQSAPYRRYAITGWLRKTG